MIIHCATKISAPCINMRFFKLLKQYIALLLVFALSRNNNKLYKYISKYLLREE